MRKLDPVKHEEKRQQILQAAARCFVRDGFRGASTSDICAEAKISPGHLYHYFPSKEAIVSAITVFGLAMATEIFSAIAQGPDVVTALLAELERGIFGGDRSKGTFMLDLLAESARNPGIGEILRERHCEIRALLAKLLQEGQERGQVDVDLDPDLAASILISFIDGAKAMTIRDPGLDAANTTEMLKIAISRFLRPPSNKASAKKRQHRGV
ncbi:TetR/AcrR family transcriptional regulator [Bradyrhizobium icense]|uniref:HTH tetR-type domain-containing protein n=1 Tax=Bradyrhizobium icense TaxID=1274631 RepID=A0A1B1UA65_9BRAD|nr:TetR/AcrR family transcriptional regulator [Bradyrhizobium icense]ANV99630.1 hypothetical protein LMTR13_05005 [Bradyrhizobium icense]